MCATAAGFKLKLCLPVQVKTLKYVIVDEVHNIVEVGRGSIYERVLAMLPCPMICLSATVGNVPTLWSWLKSLQEQKPWAGGRLTMAPLVESHKRWSDLQLQVPQRSFEHCFV
jgi:ATP-dependent RNA helicase DDX60